jgi:hypothetical protein
MTYSAAGHNLPSGWLALIAAKQTDLSGLLSKSGCMKAERDAPAVYPDCRTVARTVRVGGMSKSELLAELQNSGIQLNEAGRDLFAHCEFTTSPAISTIATIELAVANLGYVRGATIAQIHERAAELGLSLCPLELGPHLRLQFPDQPEGSLGHPPSKHRAPPGSITVASGPLANDDNTPKGFYLRRIEGVLWLRGYWSAPDDIWSPEDRLVFCHPQSAA